MSEGTIQTDTRIRRTPFLTLPYKEHIYYADSLIAANYFTLIFQQYLKTFVFNIDKKFEQICRALVFDISNKSCVIYS